jgi:phage terminase small subunit
MSKLTPKQVKFVLEYLANGLNATKAAISAGYAKKSADVEGARLLVNAKVAAAISERSQIALGKLDFSVDRTLNEIARLAFFDVRKIFEADGSLKSIHAIDDDSAAAIAGLEVTELFDPIQQKDGADGEPQKHVYGLLKKIKLADKGSALDKLMRYHALYRDKMEHTGKDGGPLRFVLTRAYNPKKDETR